MILLYVVQAGIYAEVYNDDGATMIDGMECQSMEEVEIERQKSSKCEQKKVFPATFFLTIFKSNRPAPILTVFKNYYDKEIFLPNQNKSDN